MTGPRHGWEELLDPGEALLWQGEPAKGWHVQDPRAGALGVLILAFGGFCLLMPSPTPRVPSIFDLSLMFTILGALFLSIGLVLVMYQFVFAPLVLTKTRYALTDRRAFIARRLIGRSLISKDLARQEPATFEPTRPPSLRITIDPQTPAHARSLRFAFIEDADHVLAIMRKRGLIP